MAVLDKGDGETFEEEEEHAVEEALVESYEDEDRFRGEEYCGFGQHCYLMAKSFWLIVVFVCQMESVLLHGRSK